MFTVLQTLNCNTTIITIWGLDYEVKNSIDLFTIYFSDNKVKSAIYLT